MDIGFDAYDVGPGNMLRLIAEAARKRGHDTVVIPSQKLFSAFSTDELRDITSCSALVVGLASFQTENELELIKRFSGALVVVEDVPGTSLRPKAEGFFKDRAAVALVAMPQWMQKARDFGYERVEYLGPPPHWGPSYKAMTEGGSIRPRLRKARDGVNVPLADGDIVFFFSGIKAPLIVNDVLRCLSDGGMSVAGRDHFVLGFKEHPGEKPKEPGESASEDEWEKYRAAKEVYDTASPERHRILSDVTMLDFGNASLPQVIRASDVTVFTGGSTESITAAYARLTTAYYSDDVVVVHHQQVGRSGGGWFVAELGGTYALGPDDFEEGIRFLLTPEGKAALQRSQEANFTPPEDWDTAPKIVKFIEEEL